MSAHIACKTASWTGKPSIWYSLCFYNWPPSTRRKGFPSWSWVGWTSFQRWIRSKDILSIDGITGSGDDFVLNISPELVGGSVISWNDYEHNYNSPTRHDLSRFIHIQAYMASVVSYVKRKTEEGWNGTHTMELANGKRLYCKRVSKLNEGDRYCPEHFLIIHIPMCHDNHHLYLLVEDHGDHWERLDIVESPCRGGWNNSSPVDDGDVEEGHRDSDASNDDGGSEGRSTDRCQTCQGSFGTLRTIRLG